MRCADCGFENAPLIRYCGQCGEKLTAAAAAPLDSRSYTPAHLAERILTTRSALEGERKPVTVLFCDIADSTGLAERLGAERMHQLLNRFFDAALTEVHRFEGTVNQFLGDGFMALFGAPLTHEDHAKRAVLSALAIRKSIAGLADSGALGSVRLRMGMNSGMVVVGSIGDNLRMDYTAVGDTTNVAARIQGAAEPGSILVSESVWRSTQGVIETRARGERMLKGKSEPVSLYEVLQPKASANRREAQSGTALVGRQSELAEVHAMLEALEGGRGGVLGIVGDAGLGKSRLMEEARTEAQRRGLRWVQGDCVSFGRTLSYWSFRELLRRGFGIEESDDEGSIWRKFEVGMVDTFGEEAEGFIPYVGSLLALTLPEPHAGRIAQLDGLAMGHQIFRSMYQLVERMALRRPFLIAFEDWHWADATSGALLEHLLPLSDRVPVLFMVASRPETEGPAESFRRATSTQADTVLNHARNLKLSPLPADDTVDLAERTLGGGALPETVRSMLLRRSGGNPFFLGELVRNLIGTQALARDPQGEWRTTERYGTLQLPDTIEGLILARIDRLEDEAKQVLKAAAVVGRTFFYRVLKAITEAGTALDGDLAKLQNAELIGEKQQAPELEYIFKHPLIQQATYDSLLEERRQQMHREVGECIERLFEGRLEPFYSMLAYHYARGQQAAKAREYLLKAADHADKLAADEEALELYNAVLADADLSSIRGLSEFERAELEVKIGDAHFRAGRLHQAKTALIGALNRVGTPYPRSRTAVTASALAGVLRHALTGPDRSDLKNRTVQPTPESNLRALIWDRLCWIDFFVDQTAYLYDSVRLSDETRHWTSGAAKIAGRSFIGLCFDALAMSRTAERFHSRAIELAYRGNEARTKGLANYFFSMSRFHAGEWRKAADLIKTSGGIAQEAGFSRAWAGAMANWGIFMMAVGDPTWLPEEPAMVEYAEQTHDQQALAWMLLVSSRAKNLQGQHEVALAQMERNLRYFRKMPDYLSVAYALGSSIESLLAMSRLAEAIPMADEIEILVKRHRLGMTWATLPLAMVVEVRLQQMALDQAAAGSSLQRSARRALRALTRHSRRFRDEGPIEALRLQGAFEWLIGNRNKALSLWDAGEKLARQLGTVYYEARIVAERGERTGNREDLSSASALFVKSGATDKARSIAERLKA